MEDLNLYNMKVRIIKHCWFDKKRFPTFKDMSDTTGLTIRTLRRWGHDLDLPKRTAKGFQHYFLNQLKNVNK